MAAGVTRADGRQPMRRHILGQRRATEHRAQMIRHLRSVPRQQVILSRREQPFAVAPWRRDQRNPASQRFENADRRNTWKRTCIGPAWNVYRDPVSRKYLRDPVIREPAAVLDPRFRQLA